MSACALWEDKTPKKLHLWSVLYFSDDGSEDDPSDYDEEDIVSCYFCDEQYNKRNKFHHRDYDIENGVVKCTLPFMSDQCHAGEITILDRKECHLCKETRKAVELECGHTMCIRCYKELFYGYTDEERPIHITELYFNHRWFRSHYLQCSPLWSRNRDFWDEYDRYINRYMGEHNIRRIEDIDLELYITEVKNNKIDYRIWWLENSHYTNWEFKYIKGKQIILKVETDWEEWVKEKEKNISEEFICTQCSS